MRENDSRGMHTTTARSLHRLPRRAPASSTRRACGRSGPDVDEARWPRASPTSSRWRRAAASATARTATSRAARCATASIPIALRNFQKMLRETRRDSLTWVERRQQLSAWKSRGREGRARMKMKRGDGMSAQPARSSRCIAADGEHPYARLAGVERGDAAPRRPPPPRSAARPPARAASPVRAGARPRPRRAAPAGRARRGRRRAATAARSATVS